MAKKPVWIREDIVLAIHDRQIAEHGGLDGIRDIGLLQSALSRPNNLYNYGKPKPGLAQLAANYAYGLIHNHPFLDGNKRVAYVACRLFLQLNGKTIKAPQSDKYKIFMRLASGKLTEKQLAAWLTEHLSR